MDDFFDGRLVFVEGKEGRSAAERLVYFGPRDEKRAFQNCKDMAAGLREWRDAPTLRGRILETVEHRGWKVPDVLLSGDHARIAAWRLQRSRERGGEGPGEGR